MKKINIVHWYTLLTVHSWFLVLKRHVRFDNAGNFSWHVLSTERRIDYMYLCLLVYLEWALRKHAFMNFETLSCCFHSEIQDGWLQFNIQFATYKIIGTICEKPDIPYKYDVLCGRCKTTCNLTFKITSRKIWNYAKRKWMTTQLFRTGEYNYYDFAVCSHACMRCQKCCPICMEEMGATLPLRQANEKLNQKIWKYQMKKKS